MLELQSLAQGLGAGLVAVLAYSRAAALLASGRAAFFGALRPGGASMLAIPVLGEVPSLLQVLGIVVVVAGLLLAFGAAGLLLSRRVQATPAGTAGPHRRGRINAAAGYSAAHGL